MAIPGQQSGQRSERDRLAIAGASSRQRHRLRRSCGKHRTGRWLREEMFDLLRKYHVGLCIHDMPGSITPDMVTAKICYIRCHGNGEKYSGGYSDEMLQQWATKIVNWHKNHIHVFVYFNNDIGGFAPKNALTLKQMVNKKFNFD